MPFRFFTIPISAPDASTEELNTFLRGHRVLKVDRQWAGDGAWSLCVEYLDGSSGGEPASRPVQPGRPKTDYKELLSPADFAVFAKLRDVRKAISQVEAVPVYTIFTNEQLAAMVTGKATTRAALAKIEGVGDARLEKYAKRVLEVLEPAWPPPAATDEPSEKPV